MSGNFGTKNALFVLQHGIQIMVGLFGGETKFSLPKIVFGHHTFQGVLIGSLDMMKELIHLAEKQQVNFSNPKCLSDFHYR